MGGDVGPEHMLWMGYSDDAIRDIFPEWNRAGGAGQTAVRRLPEQVSRVAGGATTAEPTTEAEFDRLYPRNRARATNEADIRDRQRRLRDAAISQTDPTAEAVERQRRLDESERKSAQRRRPPTTFRRLGPHTNIFVRGKPRPRRAKAKRERKEENPFDVRFREIQQRLAEDRARLFERPNTPVRFGGGRFGGGQFGGLHGGRVVQPRYLTSAINQNEAKQIRHGRASLEQGLANRGFQGTSLASSQGAELEQGIRDRHDLMRAGRAPVPQIYTPRRVLAQHGITERFGVNPNVPQQINTQPPRRRRYPYGYGYA